MPDRFGRVIDRFELAGLDPTDLGTIQDRLRDVLGMTPTRVQVQTAAQGAADIQDFAEGVGFVIDQTPLREGRQLIERTTLRDSRGRFVRRGGLRVRQFLEEEVGF